MQWIVVIIIVWFFFLPASLCGRRPRRIRPRAKRFPDYRRPTAEPDGPAPDDDSGESDSLDSSSEESDSLDSWDNQ